MSLHYLAKYYFSKVAPTKQWQTRHVHTVRECGLGRWADTNSIRPDTNSFCSRLKNGVVWMIHFHCDLGMKYLKRYLLTETNCHVILKYSEQLLNVIFIQFSDKKLFTLATTLKNWNLLLWIASVTSVAACHVSREFIFSAPSYRLHYVFQTLIFDKVV